MVSMSTRMPGRASTMRRVASMPSRSGRLISISTRSGVSSIAFRSPSSAVLASPTTCRSGSAFNKAINPARNTPWSSAMSIRNAIGHLHQDRAPFSRDALDHQLSIQHLGAFAHAVQAHAHALRRFTRREADAVILDDQYQAVRASRDENIHTGGAGMARHVIQRLLGDAVESDFYVGGQSSADLRHGELDLQAELLAHRLDVLAQSRLQTEVIQADWAQVHRQAMEVFDDRFQYVAHLDHLCPHVHGLFGFLFDRSEE